MLNKKMLLIVILLFIISWTSMILFFINDEFTKHEYVVEITNCNSNKNDTLVFTTKGGEEVIKTFREAVPVLHIGEKRIVNVCDYKILSKKRVD